MTDAREKICYHLDRASNHSVIVTERIARYWWNVINVALFDNKLYPPERIVIKPLKDWGYCSVNSNGEVTIALSESIPTRGLFLSTLVHEMVHQWEDQIHGRMGHGKRFRQWSDRVSNYLGLDIYSDHTPEEYLNGEKQIYKRRY